MTSDPSSTAPVNRASDVPDPWHNETDNSLRGGPAFEQLVDVIRLSQDRLAGSSPSEDAVAELTRLYETIIGVLDPWLAPEGQSAAGTRHDIPGRGHPLLLPFVVDEQSENHVRGRVVFTRFYLGGGGAAHGGTLPLLFDEVLGRLSNSADRPRARTASLTVNYRHITPLDQELTVEGTIDREEGRKRWVTGRLLQGHRLVADAEGLFVTLRPGQP